MTDFHPRNNLESALERARSGQISMPDFFHLLAKSDLAVPSVSAVEPDGSGFQPLLFDKEGAQMVACFTAIERIGEFAKRAPYCLTVQGNMFLRRIPAGYGLVLNPGQPSGFDIAPEGVSRIAKEFT